MCGNESIASLNLATTNVVARPHSHPRRRGTLVRTDRLWRVAADA
jgi:hypothetical protein